MCKGCLGRDLNLTDLVSRTDVPPPFEDLDQERQRSAGEIDELHKQLSEAAADARWQRRDLSACADVTHLVVPKKLPSSISGV